MNAPVEKKIVIFVKRTEDNKPFATVYYQNGTELQNPVAFDKPTAFFANYVSKKTVTNEIKGLILDFNTKKLVDRFDISPLTDDNYCIVGSEPGRKNVVTVIKNLTDAASEKEISAPVFLTDGIHNVLMNDELLRRDNDLPPISKEELDKKYQRIESIISEGKQKVLAKAA